MSEILRRIEAGEIDPILIEEVFTDPDPDRDDRADIEMELFYESYPDDEQFSF
jgi:hypothetical protein